MPRTPIAQTLIQLEVLAQSVTTEVKADVPHLEQPHLKLQDLIEEIRKLLTERDDYQSRKQEATRNAHARIRQAKMTAHLLRKGLAEHYGPENEKLAAFAMQPFRGRKPSKKPKGSP